ncbi:hypothetical protein BC831DRAFT_388949, partial [Entophlyctis helioformis]
ICPNNCLGIGECLPSGLCRCPALDPRTQLPWFLPLGPDCSNGVDTFGYAWFPFQLSWAVTYFAGTVFLTFCTVTTFKKNDGQLAGVRHICLILINIAVGLRFIFYAIDPYCIYNIFNPILNRLLFVTFYWIALLAYVLMLLQWIEICRAAITFEQAGNVRYTYVGAGFVIFTAVALEAIIVSSQIRGKVTRGILLVDFLGFVVIIMSTIPLYIYYGQRFIYHLESMNPDKEGKRDKMLSKIRVITYGPGFNGIVCILAYMLSYVYLHSNPDMFIIGESVNRLVEIFALALFLFGVLV